MRALRILGVSAALLIAGCLSLADTPGSFPCEADSDCSGGQRCKYQPDDVEWRCVDPLSCADTSQCDEGLVCLSKTCIAKQCSTPDDARCGGYSCDLASGFRCKTSCDAAAPCSEGYGCSQGKCVPASCEPGRTGQCGGFLCREWACMSTCASASDCEAPLICVAGACTPPKEQGEGGAAGFSGEGGAAGASGKGGAAGGAQGGGAGKAGSGASGSPASCPVDVPAAATCASCLRGGCCDELSACASDTACRWCVEQTKGSHPSSCDDQAAFVALLDCSTKTCAADCTSMK